MNISRERAKLRKRIKDSDPTITVKYYHFTREVRLMDEESLRSGKKRIQPYATVSLIRITGPHEHIARGISICSDTENPDRKNGRDRALKRALTALLEGIDQKSIKNKDQNSVKRFIHDWKIFSSRYVVPAKSCYNPVLVAFEEKLLFKEEKEVVSS